MRRLIRIGLVGALAMILGTAGQAHAGLIGLSSSTPGSLYSIDETTGAATLIVDLTGTQFTSLVGLEVLDGVIYASDVYASSTAAFSFGTIDPTTGAFTALNTQGGSLNWHSLAANQGADLLYSVDLDSTNFDLVSITPDGTTITVIGAVNQYITSLAYDDANDILYGSDGDSLFTIDTATGASTLIGSTGLGGDPDGLAYDPTTRTLYLNTGQTGASLYTVDITTGAATLVGANGVNDIDGLAFLPSAVPEPNTVILAGLGALSMAGYAGWRRRKGE